MSSDNARLQDSKGFIGGELRGENAIIQIGGGVVLVGGETPEEPEEDIPEGTVPLQISIQGEVIAITWPNEERFNNPQIFAFYGDSDQPQGQYTDDVANWIRIEGGIDTEEWDTTRIAENMGFIIHKREVGQGHPEIYYRALRANVAEADWPNILPTARAVGKFNILIAGAGDDSNKYSIVSFPLEVSRSLLDNDLRDQLPGAASKADAIEVWQWTAEGFGNQEFLHEADNWKQIGEFGKVQIFPGEPYVFQTKMGSQDRIVTAVGAVLQEFAPRNIAGNLYSFVGNPYPVNLELSRINLSEDRGVHAGTASGFADQLWGWTGTAFGQQTFHDSAARTWQPIGNFEAITTLQPGRGYVYQRNPEAPAGGFDWSFTR